MTTALLAFFCGFTAYLLVDIAANRLSGETGFSIPTASLVVGIICASSAHFLGPVVAAAIFVLFVLIRTHEAAQQRKERASAKDTSQQNP